MSVLTCDRLGCNNIMCDRLSYKYGYLCSECFQELCDSDLDIDIFMKTEKRSVIYKLKHDISKYDNEFKFKKY